MGSLTLIVVGFLLATAVVMALARSSTARWERDRRASVAVRADVAAPRTPAARSIVRRSTASARAGLAALLDRASRFPPVTVVPRLLSKAGEQSLARLGSIRRVAGTARSPLRGVRVLRGRWTTSLSPASLVPRTVPRGRRRALAFLHRHERAPEAHVAPGPPENGDQSPAAR